MDQLRDTIPLFPYILSPTEKAAHSFADPEWKNHDESVLRTYFPRVLSVLKTIHQQGRSSFFLKFQDLSKNEEGVEETVNMRFIVSSVERIMNQPKFFLIGFFGSKLPDSAVVEQVWKLDDKLVSMIPRVPAILGYVTMRKDDGTFFNYVFLENEAAVGHWSGLRAHASAIQISPLYYANVRINHAVIPTTLQKIMDNPARIQCLQIIRTKYFKYEAGQLVWTGLRRYTIDEHFCSIPRFDEPRPLLVASFLGCNGFDFYSKIVQYLGKKTGMPIRMIDIAEMTRDITPRPHDLASIYQHRIDFAFTCGISYISSSRNLIPLVAPVRSEARYEGKPIYFTDIVVASDSPYQSLADLKSSTFAINERASLSGYLIPNYHLREQGGVDLYFEKIVESKAHVVSLAMVEGGRVDASAIDSVVLGMDRQLRPNSVYCTRIVASLGPYTMPPFVASNWVPSSIRKSFTKALAKIHEHEGELLAANGFAKFVEVEDANYNDIRKMMGRGARA